MKNKTYIRTSRFIFVLAIASFLIATIQGVLYYKSYDPFFKFLLVMQNSINAFGFKASVSIKDVIAFMNNDPSMLNTIVGYAYCIAVFTAPYCTISFIYKFLERILRLIIGFRRGKNCKHILIFGYNDDVKAILRNNTSDPKETCIHIITTEKIAQEEVYSMNKSGYVIHNIDVLKAKTEELPTLFAKTHVEKAKNIILFEDSSIRNFSLLQLFRLCEDDSAERIKLSEGTKISCRCEEEGIGRLIAEYYNNAAGSDAFYDLELVNFPEMQIHKMYSDIPLHKYYESSDTKLDDCTVHLLVAGLGQMGKQAVLQAMNLGVLSDKNKIIIDVFDTNIKRQKAEFINQFSTETFEITDNCVRLKNEAADGVLEINFYALNVQYLDFYSLLRKKTGDIPYTYAVITLENIDFAVNCAMQLEEIFCENGQEIPILMRMDTDRRLAGFISSENSALANVQIIDDRSCIITLDMIINREIDKRAKEYNHLYNNLSIISSDDERVSDNSDIDPETEWNRLRLFRRSSSKAAAYHDEVKNFIIPKLACECDIDLDTKLEQLLGSEGSVMKYTGSAWRMNGSEQDVLENIKKDSFAYELASLEHRRWCCYMASIGWRAGERSDRFRRNPCLVTQEKLMETKPEMCKYDLMSLMARYRKKS
ncbi:hypothetical protein [Ruminococcus flavefaciens]|uniref:hypothetical protein n=1 Tax=Ruminococcus flavefaciens TaxID=1265 RepID=UPI0026F13BD6|nr:hypothetical protein [Ruminococcus flavefaciens]MDD7517816.1 hypothetical protein [Ruminococcus flavefaciens]MDY5690574.1 hypothetical protein [Ruminococcus flavefaciens]